MSPKVGRRGRSLTTALVVAALTLLVPALAQAAFPGTNPAESPRANTPNDPGFDPCEADDPDTSPRCTSYFDEEFRKFGFSPDSANAVTAVPGQHYATGTRYVDCSQLDADG